MGAGVTIGIFNVFVLAQWLHAPIKRSGPGGRAKRAALGLGPEVVGNSLKGGTDEQAT